MTLFDDEAELFNDDAFSDKGKDNSAPLAFRMCPKTLEEYVGQEHILGEGGLLRRAVEADRISSLILYGPPGTGKTALARIIANKTMASFRWLNAAMIGLDELRKVLRQARADQRRGIKTILFLDEIHRFNKLQQDALLPDVEEGALTLIAATVENPFFYVNSALLSRSQIFELKPLAKEKLLKILRRALEDKERGLGKMGLSVDEAALEHLARVADGDARRALSALELAALTTPSDKDGKVVINKTAAEESIQKKAILYDKKGDQHYDTISAFIKSMRGGDPDAAVYWLAKMIYAGEDPRFIARRIIICASEDVGNADPMALVLSAAALKAVEFVGMPEARIPLAQAAIYVANAPKSNASYIAIEEALKDVKEEETLEVPDHLKSSGYSGAKKLGKGVGYKYPHDYAGGKVDQEYLKKDSKKKYYREKPD
jgi:putative ATPase